MEELITWQDLLSEQGDSPPVREALTGSIPAQSETKPVITLQELLQNKSLPRELGGLLEKRNELEQQFKMLTGQAEPEQDDERIKLMYPVFAHTKETRLQEKRLRARDERRGAAQRRRLEARLIDRKRVRKQAVELEIKELQILIQKNLDRQKKQQQAESRKRSRERALIQTQHERRWKEQQEEAVRRFRLKSINEILWRETREEKNRIAALEKITHRRAEEQARELHLQDRQNEAQKKIIRKRKKAKLEEARRFP